MDEKEIHLRDYLKIIKKRRYTLFTFFIITFTIVIINTYSSVPVYKATTKLLIEKIPRSELMNNFYYDPYDPDFYQTQYQLIKSVAVAQKVVKLLHLDRTYDSFIAAKENTGPAGGIKGWFKELYSTIAHILQMGNSNENVVKSSTESGTVSDSDNALKARNLAKAVSGGIIIEPVLSSRIVNVSYVSTSPELSSLIVNSVANAYIEAMLEMKMSSSKLAIKWLTEKANEEQSKIKAAEKALQSYIKENDIITIENRMALTPQKLSQMGSQHLEAETKRRETELLFNNAKKLGQSYDKAETIPAIASNPAFQSFKLQISDVEQKITDLSKKYGKKHPVMIRAISELDSLKKKRNKEIMRIVEYIKNDYELAILTEKNIRERLSETKAEAINLNEKFIQYNILKGEVENSRQLYEGLVKKIREHNITENVQTVNVWVVEKAEIPDAPFNKNSNRQILLGLIIGLAGGIGLALFLEYLDNRIKTREDAEEKLGIPVFGVTPVMKNTVAPSKAVLDEPSSLYSEGYRHIRTSLLLSSAQVHPKSVLITSMGPGEGKTVTSINLAASIAQAGLSVLLVDADLRKPRIHKTFGMDNNEGLSTFLAGASHIDIVKKGIAKNFDILPSGPIPPNPAELIGAVKLKELLQFFSNKYDIIIFDSPPLLSVSESRILSKFMDATIVVARSGKTTYDEARRGMKLLSDIDSNISGLIINAVEIEKKDYYDYYNYNEKDTAPTTN